MEQVYLAIFKHFWLSSDAMLMNVNSMNIITEFWGIKFTKYNQSMWYSNYNVFYYR